MLTSAFQNFRALLKGVEPLVKLGSRVMAKYALAGHRLSEVVRGRATRCHVLVDPVEPLVGLLIQCLDSRPDISKNPKGLAVWFSHVLAPLVATIWEREVGDETLECTT